MIKLFHRSSAASATQNFCSNRALRAFATATLCVSAFVGGCQLPATNSTNGPGANQQKSDALTLREGDVVRIAIPGAPNLDNVQTIRRDGKIALSLVGEIQAAGLKPSELQAELVRLYGPQLVSKEVTVSVVTSNFSTFISGAVLRPGKITTDRHLTILEAIMEAGGPDFAKANLKAVTVIRTDENGRTQNFVVNVKNMMDGRDKEPFYLKPSDIVIVPERFAVF